jgi:ethanolamine ammonia-lyase small subunit
MSGASRDPWVALGARTPARIALGRTGASLPTREVLSFSLAHARARDAVHARLDRGRLAARLAALGLATVEVESEAAADRQLYLRRPDLGRRLDGPSRVRLTRACSGRCDIALAIGDGLSATAVAAQAVPLVAALMPHLGRLGLAVGPVALAEGARVALGDEVGERLGARLVAMLIGERPGLSAADSLGVYLTFDPRPGRTDAERNCLSNIRPEGLAPARAAASLAWLIEAALARRTTGVTLKDESGLIAPATSPAAALETRAASGARERKRRRKRAEKPS